LKALAFGFGRKAACEARNRSKETPQAAQNVAGLKPGFFCERFAARLKSCPVTKLALMEFLQQPETFACHESSNAIALTPRLPRLDIGMDIKTAMKTVGSGWHEGSAFHP
jgi:hypothetical protein